MAHELGHLLGYEHSDDGTMDDTLATGERHMSASSVVDRSAIETSCSRSEQRLSAVFDLIFIEENEKETTWAIDRIAYDMLGDLDWAMIH